MEKCALITGGTKGIGRAVARCLAASGYRLVLTYVSDTENARCVKQELEQAFAVPVSVLQADCSRMESVDEIDAYLTNAGICPTALVLNAGATSRIPFDEIAPADWLRVFDANVHFPVFLIQRLAGRMPAGSSVVFTGSLMGIEPHSVSLVYGVTKAAVHALVRNLVKFLEPHAMRVNAVAPGFVDTEWQKNKPEEIRKNIERKVALHRFCDPDELAEVYKMLIENSYLNGEIVVVDGGYSYK